MKVKQSKFYNKILLFLLGGGTENDAEAEGRTEYTHRDAGLGGGGGGYVSNTVIFFSRIVNPVTNIINTVTVRWLPRHLVIITTHHYTSTGQQLNSAVDDIDSSHRNDSAEPRLVSKRRARHHPLSQQRQCQPTDAGRCAARACSCRGGQETNSS